MSRHTIDFLRRPQPPAIGWVLLVLGLLALATALGLEQRWTRERLTLQNAAQLARAQQQAREAPPPPVEPTLAQRRWQQAQGELRRPWLPALRAIESATVNPVFLLSMTLEPSKGLIKLEGEAPSFDHALAFVQVLDTGGVLQPAALVSHESITSAAGTASVRFSAMTHWVSSQAPPQAMRQESSQRP